MLHDKEQSSFLNEGKLFKTDFSSDEEEEDKDKQYFSDDSSDNYNNNKSNMLVPFSFKVAKALDPNMYRNIEYDTWIEVRRGKNYLCFCIFVIKAILIIFSFSFRRLVLR